MLVLQIFIFCIQTILKSQAAEMKITSLSQLGKLGNQEGRISDIHKSEQLDNTYNELLLKPVSKRDCKKPNYFQFDDINCKHPLNMLNSIEETSKNYFYSTSKKSHLSNKILTKREVPVIETGDQNSSNILTEYPSGVNVRLNTKTGLDKNVLNFINRDFDNFYDHELINKLSDSEGKLPSSLKLIIPADNEPVVVANESNDNLKDMNVKKRNVDSKKTNAYDEYSYYDDQLLEDDKLNSADYENKIKVSTPGNIINRPVNILNNSGSDSSKLVTNSASAGALTNSKEFESSAAVAENKSNETYNRYMVNKLTEVEESLKSKNEDLKIKDTSNDNIKAVVKRKGTCPPPKPGAGQGCHPGGGLPKNPALPPLNKVGRDPEYMKLLKGETTESIVKGILEKLLANPQLSTELGICNFDISEQRTLFKHMRSKEKKECCSKLKGEFKCFLNWLLTIEPSRKKRSDSSQETLNTCNKFPKFSLMGDRDCCKPSPQYEKLVQKVEEYKDENNNL